jgi:NAD(P)-dependent dehydrogenase (short-subunit alcohol dehydrogenase family)
VESATAPMDTPVDWLDLSGRTALVTGANQGIGWEIAVMLATHGARVAINYPDPSSRPEALGPLGSGAVAVQGDIGFAEEISRVFEEVDRAFNRLDILVNNAGIFPRAPVLDLDEGMWDRVLAVNLKGTFLCSQHAARKMAAQGSGAIVNIASESALVPDPLGAHYCASKAGIVALTKCFALALAPAHVRVNAVAPGMTDTAQPRYGYTEEQIATRGAANPTGRIASPSDVARAALYLVSPMSEYVTGQTLFVTGGDVMVP